MKNSKLKDFWDKNKATIIFGGAAALASAAIVAGVIFDSKSKSLANLKAIPVNDLPIPKIEVGNITDFWYYNDWTNMIVSDLTIGDLGALGKELIKHALVPDGARISIILGFPTK